ncbi:type I-E CRISPR-associated protein Cas7/Cse4/CasC [Streptomyces xanthochromogenes]|uniref:type I-E CRISPR-associated protein Cas7/Cse4/CasC n=1 Tax=Streptomyces xanthochromogenes TaxID=67384 RepID=UPI0034145C78
MHRYLNLHKLLTVNSVLLVRDADGHPKETPFGNERRIMLSPQTQRRADRTYLRDQANMGRGPLADYSFGCRTREWARLTASALCTQHNWKEEEAALTVRAALQGLGINFGTKDSTADLTKVMIFAPESAATKLAAALHTHADDIRAWVSDVTAARTRQEEKKKPKGKKKVAAAEEELPELTEETSDEAGKAEPAKLPPLPAKLRNDMLLALAPADAIDIALFGRFLAEVSHSPNVDGSLQTMPAITVGRSAICEDFYAAADDAKLARQRIPAPADLSTLDFLEAIDPFPADGKDGDHQGAGMTGYQYFVSGTFYAHTVVDRFQLRVNLHRAGMKAADVDKAARAAEAAYVDAFCNAVPEAKKTTTAAPGTMPKLVLAHASDRQHNYVTCFENAIDEKNTVASIEATHRLLSQHALASRKYGLEPGAVLTYDLAITELLDTMRTEGRLQPREVDRHDQLADATTADLATMPA